MKKKVLSLMGSALMIGGLLAGCGSSEESNGSKQQEKKDPPKQAEQKKVENPKKDDQGNYVLEKPGQVAKSDQATAELVKIKNVNEVVNIAPIKVIVKDMKLIKLTNINQDMKDQIEYMNEKKVIEPLYYLQVRYSAENTSDKNIAFNGLHKAVTDKGEMLDPNKNFLTSDFDHEFLGKVTQEDQYGMVIGQGKEDINKVKLIFNESADNDSYDTITPEQQVEYTFN